MAKRKKAKPRKSGGAFGKAKSRRAEEVIVPFPSAGELTEDHGGALTDGISSELIEQRMREKDEFMAMVGRELDKQNFSSPEEAQAFMNEHFVGRPMGEVLGEYGRFEDSPEGRALEILDEIPPGVSVAKLRAAVKRALKEDPDCVDAYMILAQTQTSLEKEIEFNEQAVAAGRRKFADLIASIDPQGEHGLWGVTEARPFMGAVQELAEKRRMLGDVDAAVQLYEELMAINPGDNQGIRYELLVTYLGEDEWDRAQEILDKFADDQGCTVLFSRLFLELGKLAEKVEMNFAEGLEDPLDRLPEKATSKARAALKTAVEGYPWAVGMLADMRINLVEPLATYRFGAPSEALEYARLAVANWLGAPMAVMWLLTKTRDIIEDKNCRKVLRKYHEEFVDVCDSIDELPPFEDLALAAIASDSDDDRELADLMATFSEASVNIRALMLHLGAG